MLEIGSQQKAYGNQVALGAIATGRALTAWIRLFMASTKPLDMLEQKCSTESIEVLAQGGTRKFEGMQARASCQAGDLGGQLARGVVGIAHLREHGAQGFLQALGPQPSGWSVVGGASGGSGPRGSNGAHH